MSKVERKQARIAKMTARLDQAKSAGNEKREARIAARLEKLQA